MYGEPYDRYGRLGDGDVPVLPPGGGHRDERPRLDPGAGPGVPPRRLLESETQLATETLRYSVDIPGQALAYKVGAMAILDLRRHAREALGEGFDIRRFHQAVLDHGALPLDVLAEHVEWWIGQERERLGLPAAAGK